MTDVLRFVAAGLAVVLALISGLLFSAARSDFTFRGCETLPRADWSATVNCADGWLAQVVFGGLCVVLMPIAVLLWRGRMAK